jgi:predicted TPR repeat methyltransferase
MVVEGVQRAIVTAHHEQADVAEQSVSETAMSTWQKLSALDAQTVKGRFKELLLSPLTACRDVVKVFNHIPERNISLAEEMLADGDASDAVLRLKIALWFDSSNYLAHYLLGVAYLSLDKSQEAVTSFKAALKLNPSHEEALYTLATMGEDYLPSGVKPTHMPKDTVQRYFDAIAGMYNQDQQERKYAAHVYANDFLRRHVDSDRVNYRILDLGCGTGKMGEVVFDLALSVTGVDFSKAMLHEAVQLQYNTGEQVYDRVILREIQEFLGAQEDARYDIITMVHVAMYFGDLTTLFKGVAASLVDGGVFVLQTSFSPQPTEYGIIPKVGLFGHSEEYVQELSRANGLICVAREDFRAYPDQLMQQFILRKG